MHNMNADHEKIREVMIRFGEILDAQGYPKVLEDIEGQGAIGKAVANPRSLQSLKVIDKFLKDIGKELGKEAPSQERANGLSALKTTFKQVKGSITAV